MNQKEINKSIKELKINLNQSELTAHWLNFVFLSIPLILICFVTIESGISNGELPYSVFILVTLFILLIRHKLICTKLDSYKSNLSETQFKESNSASAKLNEWIILSNRKNYFCAIKSTNWQWDGVRVTAIFKDGRIFLNSMVNPSSRSNPFTLGINKKNKLELIKHYKLVLEGTDVIELASEKIAEKEEAFWNESEWSLRNLLKRLIGYGLAIPFIILGVWIIGQQDLNGLIYGVTLIGCSATYLYNDVKTIIEKRNRKKPGYNKVPPP